MSKTTFLGDFSCPTFSGSKLGGVGYCITIIGRINRFVWGEFFSMKHFCHKRRNFLTPDLRNSSFFGICRLSFQKKSWTPIGSEWILLFSFLFMAQKDFFQFSEIDYFCHFWNCHSWSLFPMFYCFRTERLHRKTFSATKQRLVSITSSKISP